MGIAFPLLIFSSVSFFAYGLSCLVSQHMRREFDRYGLRRWRTTTGWLEIAGAAGLMVGLAYPIVGAFAAGGLTLLMFMGLIVRLRIKDPLWLALPATVYALINLYLFINLFLTM